MSSAKTTSPTPSPTPRTSMAGQQEKACSSESSSDRDQQLSPIGSPKGDRGWSTQGTRRTPMHERAIPPTLEEIEAMESQGAFNNDRSDERSPSTACPSYGAFQPQAPTPRIQSRQVLRVSGTGRSAMQDQHTQRIDSEGGTEDGHPMTPSECSGGLQPHHNSDPVNRSSLQTSPPSGQLGLQREQELPKHRIKHELQGPVSFRVQPDRQGQASITKPVVARWVDTRVEQSRRVMRENAQRRVPYAYGTPASWEDRSKKLERSSKGTVNQAERGYDNAEGDDEQDAVGCVAVAAPDQPRSLSARGAEGDTSNVQELRRRSISAPNLSDVSFIYSDVIEPETAKEAKDDVIPTLSRRSSGEFESPPSVACWGGGLPPKAGPIAHAPQAGKPVPRAPVGVDRTSERRSSCDKYPVSERDSFARTLNSEELEEVWQGLGEGVSQRGIGSEVSFAVAPSPRTSGGFPKLTANALEQFQQRLAEQQRTGQEGPRVVNEIGNAVPIPKRLVHEGELDLEAGSPSSKKSSSRQQPPSLLSAIVAYGMLVLWAAYLVYNGLLLWRYVGSEPVWVFCFLPGILGILLSVKGCRRAHSCEPDPMDESPRGINSPPHPCALPSHLLLTMTVAVALALHASALLVCEHGMTLFFTESTVGSICDEKSLLFPVIIDCVLLAVTSLKCSSLCWAWILS